ncbi:restriction endonuclease subunit S [Streptomyces sp. NPDC047980]|uniref:restriction endonuclease subunit S n=1 Tax=Streptomyces sp. NPDC047980 TaxID=3365494 RepID=UPI0037101C2B
MTLWPDMKVGRAARLISGVGFPHQYQGKTSGAHPFLKVSDLASAVSGYRLVTAQNWVGQADLASLGARLAPMGAIVFPKVGAAMLKNPRCLLDLPAAMDNNLMAVVPNSGEPRFWLYALSTIDLSEIAAGGALPYVNEGQIRDLRIPFPSVEQQRRIADFLDAETARIDKLIQLYSRMSGLADERSQRVLDEAIEAETNLVPLRYAVRFREGPGIMAVDFKDDGVPLIRIAGLKKGEVTLSGCNFLDPAKVAQQWSQFRLRVGDRLISGSATMGEVSVVRDPAVAGSIPYTGLIILRPVEDSVDMEYVEAYLRSSHFAHQINLLKTGATMQHFGPTHLSQVRAPLPSLDDQRRTAAIARGALRHASTCDELTRRQVALLNERRQALITAAVTGQFDVATASGRNVTEGVTV